MRLRRPTRKPLAVRCTRDIVSPKEIRMYTLFARPGAGSAAVEALLALLAVPHDIKDVPKEPMRVPPPTGTSPSIRAAKCRA
jgi:hypothetical protein